VFVWLKVYIFLLFLIKIFKIFTQKMHVFNNLCNKYMHWIDGTEITHGQKSKTTKYHCYGTESYRW